MEKLISLFFAALMLLTLTGCNGKGGDTETESTNAEVNDATQSETASQNDPLILDSADFKSICVQYKDESAFLGLNADKLGISKELHIPILKIDSLDEFESFKSLHNDSLRLDIDHNYDGSFYDETERYDKDFFNINSLLIIDVKSTSGSYRYGVESIYLKDQYCTVYVEQTKNLEDVTDDMAEWLIVVPIEKSKIKDVIEFDAIRKTND